MTYSTVFNVFLLPTVNWHRLCLHPDWMKMRVISHLLLTDAAGLCCWLAHPDTPLAPAYWPDSGMNCRLHDTPIGAGPCSGSNITDFSKPTKFETLQRYHILLFVKHHFSNLEVFGRRLTEWCLTQFVWCVRLCALRCHAGHSCWAWAAHGPRSRVVRMPVCALPDLQPDSASHRPDQLSTHPHFVCLQSATLITLMSNYNIFVIKLNFFYKTYKWSTNRTQCSDGQWCERCYDVVVSVLMLLTAAICPGEQLWILQKMYLI